MANRHPHNDWVGQCTCKDYHSEAMLNLLTDISESLQEIASTLRCRNFINIPRKLDQLVTNTGKKTRATKLRSVA